MESRTVLLADRHSSMLEGLRLLLEGCCKAVIMVADQPSLFEAIKRLQPAFAIVDVSFPCVDRDGDNIIGLLHERAPNLKIIALSVHDEWVVAERVLELGAMGFVVKGTAVCDLLPALDAVSRGEKYVSPCARPPGYLKEATG